MPRGFTLTELLVAMAVVFLLVVLLITTVSGAMTSARRTGCVSNIRGQLVGLLAHSTDHGKRLLAGGE